MRCFRLFCLMLVAAYLAMAGGERVSVSGTVTNSYTGEPVARVLVKALGPGVTRFAFSDASGHFNIENLPAG